MSLAPRRSFAELVTLLKEVRKTHIVFGFSLDSLVATALLIHVLKSLDIEFDVSPYTSMRKPLDTEAPLILVDVRQRTVVSGVKILQLSDFLARRQSTAAALAHALRNVWIVPSELLKISVSAMLSTASTTMYDDALIEAHEDFVRELESEGVLRRVQSAVRLFGYPVRDLVEAMSRTLEPFLPGLSLSVDECRKFLEERGISSLVDASVRARFCEELRARRREYGLEVPDVEGSRIVVEGGEGVVDVYEAVYALSALIDSLGYEYVVSIGVDTAYISLANAALYSSYSCIKRVLEGVVSGETKLKRIYVRGTRVSLIELDEECRCINAVYRALRGNGLCDHVLLVRVGNEVLAPITILDPRYPADYCPEIRWGAAVFSTIDEALRAVSP